MPREILAIGCAAPSANQKCANQPTKSAPLHAIEPQAPPPSSRIRKQRPCVTRPGCPAQTCVRCVMPAALARYAAAWQGPALLPCFSRHDLYGVGLPLRRHSGARGLKPAPGMTTEKFYASEIRCRSSTAFRSFPPQSMKVFRGLATRSGNAGAPAKLMLVLLAFAWGLSWPVMKIALDEVGVWMLRFLGAFDAHGGSVRLGQALGSQPRHCPRHRAVARRRRLPGQRRRLRTLRLLCSALRHHLAGGDRQLFHADLGKPDGVADPRRAIDPASGHRIGAVRRRPPARRSGRRPAIGRGIAARTRLRALLGRRHRLHEMGKNPR